MNSERKPPEGHDADAIINSVLGSGAGANAAVWHWWHLLQTVKMGTALCMAMPTEWKWSSRMAMLQPPNHRSRRKGTACCVCASVRKQNRLVNTGLFLPHSINVILTKEIVFVILITQKNG